MQDPRGGEAAPPSCQSLPAAWQERPTNFPPSTGPSVCPTPFLGNTTQSRAVLEWGTVPPCPAERAQKGQGAPALTWPFWPFPIPAQCRAGECFQPLSPELVLVAIGTLAHSELSPSFRKGPHCSTSGVGCQLANTGAKEGPSLLLPH